MCLVSFFFFSRYGDYRDLHSFPTRRSSDLNHVQEAPMRSVHIIGVPLDLGGNRRGTDMGPSAFRIAGIGEQLTDRKSTRLNSSHSQISYAVFCLKKKTKNE